MAGGIDLSQLGALSGQTNAMPQREDDLLAKIQDLLQQYLSLGAGTPVADQAQQLSDAIDSHLSGGGDLGTAPGEPSPAAPPTPPTGEVDQGYTGSDFGQARKGAASFLKSKKNKAKAQPK